MLLEGIPVDRDDSDAAAGRAAERVTFRLTYAHTSGSRQFAVGTLSGPPIPCAYGNELMASGDWDDPDDGQLRTEVGWLDHFLRSVVGETVHEGLEHYQVDGRPWLDPHGPAEREIHEAVGRLHGDLVAIRRRYQHVIAEAVPTAAPAE